MGSTEECQMLLHTQYIPSPQCMISQHLCEDVIHKYSRMSPLALSTKPPSIAQKQASLPTNDDTFSSLSSSSSVNDGKQPAETKTTPVTQKHVSCPLKDETSSSSSLLSSLDCGKKDMK